MDSDPRALAAQVLAACPYSQEYADLSSMAAPALARRVVELESERDRLALALGVQRDLEEALTEALHDIWAREVQDGEKCPLCSETDECDEDCLARKLGFE